MAYTQIKVFKTNQNNPEIEKAVNEFLSQQEFKDGIWKSLGAPITTIIQNDKYYKEVNVFYEVKDAPVQKGTCPHCQKPLILKTFNGRSFVGCTGFPQCRYTQNV